MKRLKNMENKIKTISASKFEDENANFVFPFEVLDKTPGGSNLGRIHFAIEPIKGKKKKGVYHIEKLLVWVRQTRDKRYLKKIFEIPCMSASIFASPLRSRGPFIHQIWRTSFCNDHGSLILEAYPEDHHKRLVINISSGIAIDINFE